MRRIGVLLVAALLLGGAIAATPLRTQAQSSDYWLCYFFNNRAVFGDPVYTIRAPRVSFNWGGDSPAPGVNADNYSMRCERFITLGTGTYVMTAVADDGVRASINGVPYFDSLYSGGANRAHEVRFQLVAGDYLFQVDFVENTGTASIEFALRAYVPPPAPSATATPPPGTPAPFTPATLAPTPDLTTGAVLVVATATLNVRSAPSTDARILTTVSRFEAYRILGRNSDSTWYQILVDNNRVVGQVVGWVSAEFVRVRSGDASTIPVTFINTIPARTGIRVEATALLNLRSQPSTDAPALGIILPPGRMEVLGRTDDWNWYYVDIEGFLGWVSSDFVVFVGNPDTALIPVLEP
jgi:uncharacterized protein YgiM (DUF1202 family)